MVCVHVCLCVFECVLWEDVFMCSHMSSVCDLCVLVCVCVCVCVCVSVCVCVVMLYVCGVHVNVV